MPMMSRGKEAFTRRRVLISGLSNTGKTWSLASFAEAQQSTVILSCPGETGVHSLPEDTDELTSYYFTNATERDRRSVEFCQTALREFDALFIETEKNKPDKLFIDGAHNLYDLQFNIITGGLFLAGEDLKAGDGKGYAAAAFYNRGHVAFGNRLKRYYDSSIPFIGLTTWEKLLGAVSGDEGGAGNKIDIRDERYWWPAIPGEMAMRVVGYFDARLSARLEKRCLHTNCELTMQSEAHHVWQFYPRNDVAGVGIKGLRMSKAMQERPYIHQTWPALRSLLNRTMTHEE